MKEKLIGLINEFGGLLTTDEYNQYVPKLRDYLIPYILEDFREGFNIDRIFKDEFTRSNVVKATMHYVTSNENVESMSAIDDYLIAINRLFDELLFERYPNPTLMKYKPFTTLSNEVKEKLENMGVILKKREVNPSIDKEQFKFIIDYLKKYAKTNIKAIQVKIIIKIMLLYGFSHDIIAKFTISDFNYKQKTLRVEYKRVMKRYVYLELPYSLAQEIDEYLRIRNKNSELNSELLFITENNTRIDNGFIKYILDKIKESYIEEHEVRLDKNQFTATGLQKYAIKQMIMGSMNQSIIMDFSGQEEDIYNDCQNEVNRIKELDRNRYINHMIRGINTYDEI